MKVLKIFGLSLGGVVLVLAGFVTFCYVRFSSMTEEKYPMHPELTAIAQSDFKGDLEIGKRIYTVRSGCIDCHGADLSGVKFIDSGAMGTIYGANISPFKMKDLKDEDLMRAIRYGVHATGRSLRAMPSMDYEGLSKEDLTSVIAYLRSMPAVEKEPPASTYGPVARIMGSLGKIPILFPAKFIDHTKGFNEKPAEEPTVEFGKYLANACVGCHGSEYRGGPIPGGDPSWPHAPDIRLGAAGWDKSAFVKMIQTGISKYTGQPVRVPMPIASLQQLNEVELEALWQFLSSLK